MITNKDLIIADKEIQRKRAEYAKNNLLAFTRYTMDNFESTPFHKVYYKVLGMFARGEIKRLMITVPPQHGKALSIDTPVLTTEGWKRHGNLMPGDYVFGENGNPREVLENHGAHFNDSSIVRFSGGESLIASEKHEWAVDCDRHKYRIKGQKSERVREILETNNLLIKQRRNPAINANIEVSFKDNNLLINPYVFGCWLGDGTSTWGALTCGSEDIDHFKDLGGCKEVKKGIYQIRLDFGAKKLRELNVFRNKHIPVNYLMSSREQRVELLRGLMDTDGTVDKYGRCEFTQKTGRLANDVYVLMRSLGLKPTRHTYDMKLNGVKVGLKDRVFVSKPSFRIFNLARKAAKQQYNTRIDSTRFFIEEIEPIGLHEVNCITVDGGLYLAGEQLILTHNSEGSTRRMPAFILGQRPNTKIAVASYNATFARKFNRDVQRIIDSKEYHNVFPNTTLNNSNVVTVSSSYLRNSDEFEVVDKKGGLKAVGRGGPLTGNQVDVMVMDDLYKDFAEGNSPVIREAVWDWYTSVVRTRMHNDSQEIIVFTRWHEDDLIGRIEHKEEVITVKTWDDIKNANPKAWIKINFEALKTGEPTEVDPREVDQPLYPTKHNAEKLKDDRRNDPVKFDALYQGNPTSKDGLLYGTFKEYTQLPDNIIIRKNYTDTADTGDDWLYSIDYDVSADGYAYVIDIRCSQESMEVTEPLTAGGLLKNNVNEADIESNNGGRGFARKIDEMTGHRCAINWFHQSANKESRIISQSATVMQRVIMPDKWHLKFPVAYAHLTSFKRKFKANIHDDAADVITGIVEKMDSHDNGSMFLEIEDL